MARATARPSRQTLLAGASLVVGALAAYGLWWALTGGDVPLSEDYPPRRYTLALSLALGAALSALLYYSVRNALRRRGAWD